MAWDWSGAGSGAVGGAGTGSAFGPWGSAIGGAAGGLLGGLFGGSGSKETSIQKKQRELVDQLLGSLNGKGPYSNLFTANEEDFQRSYVDPAKSRFQNQTAPQIQQSYIQSGQQRGTGLDDTLTRAGVDMDSLLNEAYMNYQQGAQNRQASAIGNILGQGAGAQPEQSGWQSALQGLGGYASSDSFGKDLEGILSSFNDRKYNQSDSLQDTFVPPRKGFENEQYYNPYTGIMGGQ